MSKLILKCLKNTHPDIELPNFVPVIIGRSPLTQITNKRLSKKHCKFVANLAKKQGIMDAVKTFILDRI